MSFRELILEEVSQEEHIADTTNEDISNLLSHLDLSPEQLEDIAEDILESYVLFNDEFEYIEDENFDELQENEIVVEDELEDDEDELDEAFQKVSKGKRMQDRRKSRKLRRKAVVKKDLKKRAQKSQK
jgi:hypothetical protein